VSTMSDAHASRWQKHGNTAQMVSAFMAVAGIGALMLQLNSIRNNGREATAQQIYLNYVRVGLDYPQFAQPDYDQIKAGGEQDLTRYRWFVSLMMFACDEVLENIDSDEWRRSCGYDLRTHVHFLCENADARFLSQFSPRMGALVTAAVSEARASIPECSKPRPS
jgi:hypothetical protein